MKLKVKPLSENYNLPVYGSDYAAGIDLYSNTHLVIKPNGRSAVPTGISIEWGKESEEDTSNPCDYYLQIAPRSGLALKHGIDVGGGVIDYDYRGEIMVILFNHGNSDFEIKPNERIAQAILTKINRFNSIELVENLTDSTRGNNGFGSTGVK